jgi:hypothetical protein
MQFIKNRLFLNGVNPVFYRAELSIFPRGIPEKEGFCLQKIYNYLNLYGFSNWDKFQVMSPGDGIMGCFAVNNFDGFVRISPAGRDKWPFYETTSF